MNGRNTHRLWIFLCILISKFFTSIWNDTSIYTMIGYWITNLYHYLEYIFYNVLCLVGVWKAFLWFSTFLCTCAVYGKSCRISNEADHDIKREHQDHLVSLPGFWEPWLDRTLFERWRFHCSAAFRYDLNTYEIVRKTAVQSNKNDFIYSFFADVVSVRKFG